MGLRSALHRLGPAALAAVLVVGCGGSSDPKPAPKADGNVFIDDFGAGVSFQAFSGATGEVAVDTSVKYAGTASLKVQIPASPAWNGGAFPTDTARDLSSFNALTLRVRASRAVTLDVVGFGNDNTGESLYDAALKAVPVTTEWTEVVIPIPLPSKLTAEKGLLYFGEGESGEAYTLWFDDVKFVTLPAERLGPAQPSIESASVTVPVGNTREIAATNVTFAVDGSDLVVEAQPTWFTFTSDHPEFASVDANGVITAVAIGTAAVTAKLGELDAENVVNVEVVGATVPTVRAPVPTAAAGDVISLFSDAYTAHPVDTWSTSWDQTGDPVDVAIAGDAAKKYTNLVFAGIEFTGANLVDASTMAYFHVDVWTPDATVFKVKLVDFGADGAYGTGDESEHELTFTPANAQWVSLDMPFADFTGLTARAHLAQLIFVSSDATVFLDNVYFHK